MTGAEACFHDEDVALAFLERIRWPDGPACPRCSESVRVGRLRGQSVGLGARACYVCSKQFNVKTGTVLERTRIPLRFWLQTFYLSACVDVVKCDRLGFVLGTTFKTAWLMRTRIEQLVERAAPARGSRDAEA